MKLIDRFQGAFLTPQQTFQALSQRPAWKDALIILTIAVIAFSYLTYPYVQQDSLKLMESNIKLKERMGEERYNQTLESMRNPSQASLLPRRLILPPISFLIGFLISSLVIQVIGRMTSTEGNFIQIFSAYLHANFIDKVLGNGLRLFLVLTRKTYLGTTTSLAIFFPRLEATSKTFILLSQFDFFQFWMFGVLAYGLSSIFKIPLKKAFFVSFGFWLIKSIFYIALQFLTMRLMQ